MIVTRQVKGLTFILCMNIYSAFSDTKLYSSSISCLCPAIGVSRISGIFSRDLSDIISWKQVRPIFPFPIDAWWSTREPRSPDEQQRTTINVSNKHQLQQQKTNQFICTSNLIIDKINNITPYGFIESLFQLHLKPSFPNGLWLWL